MPLRWQILCPQRKGQAIARARQHSTTFDHSQVLVIQFQVMQGWEWLRLLGLWVDQRTQRQSKSSIGAASRKRTCTRAGCYLGSSAPIRSSTQPHFWSLIHSGSSDSCQSCSSSTKSCSVAPGSSGCCALHSYSNRPSYSKDLLAASIQRRSHLFPELLRTVLKDQANTLGLECHLRLPKSAFSGQVWPISLVSSCIGPSTSSYGACSN